jgi:hypothetical protein
MFVVTKINFLNEFTKCFPKQKFFFLFLTKNDKNTEGVKAFRIWNVGCRTVCYLA